MTWLDVLKRKRGNKRKRVPYNPFTGEGDKQTNIEDRMKAKDEKTKKREAKVAESFKKVPRARVSIQRGGDGNPRIYNRKKDFNLNPKTKCAMCGIKLAINQQTKTENNAADLTYCDACARTIEGKPIASYGRRKNAKGDIISNNNYKLRPKRGRPR